MSLITRGELSQVRRPVRRVRNVSDASARVRLVRWHLCPAGHLHFRPGQFGAYQMHASFDSRTCMDIRHHRQVIKSGNFADFPYSRSASSFPLLVQYIYGYAGLDWVLYHVECDTTPPECPPGYREPPSLIVLSSSRLQPCQASSLEVRFSDSRKLGG
jgi:hypothetical protein